METSLAQQLKKLAVPQTTLLLENRVKASFLFDPSVVANLSRDEIYEIGLTGLQELQLIDSNFEEFEQTLFGETSKSFERSIQTTEINARLDDRIHHFLTLLSPYFLLRPAHKALEWLVNRYHIELYNVDSLISCILPYHETRHFVRALQMIDLSNPAGCWHWLLPLQKPGVPLPKSTLFTHCYKDNSFLKFICDMIPNAIKVHGETSSSLQIFISFYISTVLGMLENSDQVTEIMISTLLPFILKGLRSQNTDYCSTSYMIICQLTRKTSMISSLLKEIVTRITKNLVPKLRKEAIMCLLVIYQHQSLKEFPRIALINIKKTTGFVKALSSMTKEYSITEFLLPMLNQLLRAVLKGDLTSSKKQKKKPLWKFLTRILTTVDMKKKEVMFTMRTLLKHYKKKSKEYSRNALNKKILKKRTSNIMTLLERRCPEYFDEGLEKYIKNMPNSLGLLRNILKSSFSSSKHQILSKASISLFLGVNHPHIVVRSASMNSFVTKVKQNKIIDKDFIKSTIIKGLEDDSPDIVCSILQLDKISELLPQDKLTDALNKILKRNRGEKNEWFKIQKSAMRTLCKLPYSEEQSNMWLATVFSYMLPTDIKTATFLKIILSSPLRELIPLLQNMKNIETLLDQILLKKDSKSIKTLNCEIIMMMGNSIMHMEGSMREAVFDTLRCIASHQRDDFPCGQLITLLLLQYLVFHLPKNEDQLVVATNATQYCSLLHQTCKHIPYEKSNDLEDIMSQWISNKGKFLPSAAVVFCLKIIILSIQSESFLQGEEQWFNLDFSSGENNYYRKLLAQLFYIITEQATATSSLSSAFQDLLVSLFKLHLTSREILLCFLSSFWSVHYLQLTDSDPLISSIQQVRSLMIASCILSKEKSTNWIFEGESIVFPSLLVALSSSLDPLRKAALNCLQIMHGKCDASNNFYYLLASEIKNHSKEIQTDVEQFPQIVCKFLTPNEYPTRRSIKSPIRRVQQLTQTICNKETPDYIRHGLLVALKETNSKEILTALLPLLKVKLEFAESKVLSANELAIIDLILSKYTCLNANLIISNDGDFYVALSSSLKTVKIGEKQDTSIQEMALKVLTKDFFEEIPSKEVQENILASLAELCLSSTSITTKNLLTKTLRKLCYDASLLVDILQRYGESSCGTTVKEVKRQRTTKTLSSVEELNEEKWKKIIFVLEIIEARKNMQHPELLLPTLFAFLKQSLERENHPSSEYFRQVILSSLHTCCQHLESAKCLDEEKFQVEMIVQCVRVSDNPQTQNQALIVLNLAAKLFPEHIMHNIIAIFTFMGASLIRQDNNYSFQVISQTVKTIIPALLQASSQKQDNDVLQIVGSVTRVFVDALPDIPEHRRMSLFITLMTTLGAERFLWLILAQIIEICITRKMDENSEEEKKNLHPFLEFSLWLCQHFPANIQLNACVLLTRYLIKLPNENEFTAKKSSETIAEPFDVKKHTLNQLKYFKYNTVVFMVALLSSQAFIGQIVDATKSHRKKIEESYQQLLEIILQYIQNIAPLLQDNSQESNLKFWKSFLHKLYDLLDKTNSLLPSDQFISVLRALIKHQIPAVRRKAMEMLSAKLLHQHGFFSASDEPALLSFVKQLTQVCKQGIATTEELASESNENHQIINSQIALYCLKLLCKMLASNNPEAFKKVLKTVITVLKKSKMSLQLNASALLCLAELCHCLGIHVLPRLVDFMPFVLEILKNQDLLTSNRLMLTSAVMTVHHLTENLALFLSMYLDDLLMQVCIISTITSEMENQNALLRHRLTSIYTHLAETVPLRVLLPSIEYCYKETNVSCYKTVEHLMFVLTKKVSLMQKSELNSNISNLQSFIFTILNFRCEHEKLPLREIERTEDSIIEMLTSLILKLSEITFKPFFLQLFDWATTNDDQRSRIIIFYRVTKSFSEKLKSLFVSYLGHFVRNAASLLDTNNLCKSDDTYFPNDASGIEKINSLLNYILDTLHMCFLHDNEKFIDKCIFDVVMQPLVDQIENIIGTDKEYHNRIINHLSPCIAQFAVALADDTMWKLLNYQIMLKTHHNAAKVRFATLHILRDIVQKLGEAYLTVLPESIQFLSELMEDESPEVEKQCHSVVSDMGKILGEPLMKYF